MRKQIEISSTHFILAEKITGENIGTKVKKGQSDACQEQCMSAEQLVELPKVVHSQTLTRKVRGLSLLQRN
jgi:hypothetical protein